MFWIHELAGGGHPPPRARIEFKNQENPKSICIFYDFLNWGGGHPPQKPKMNSWIQNINLRPVLIFLALGIFTRAFT